MKMNKIEYPLVSICCITYNHAPFIRQCLEGFLMQKGVVYEILIHDDCSTDGTTEIIKEYAAKYPDLIFPLYETENQYSKGVDVDIYNYRRVKGKYIAYCEGDDYWTDPLKLQRQVDFMESHSNCSMCYTDCDIYFEETKDFQRSLFANSVSYIDKINPFMSYGYLGNCTWLWRANIQVYDAQQKFKIIDGALESLYLLAKQGDVDYVEGSSMAIYRRHRGSASCFDKVDDERKYQYAKSVFLLRERFADQFGTPNENKKRLYTTALRNVYTQALIRKDNEMISIFRNYYRNKFESDTIERILLDLYHIRKSKSYQLGRFLTKPITVIREKINNKRFKKEI